MNGMGIGPTTQIEVDEFGRQIVHQIVSPQTGGLLLQRDAYGNPMSNHMRRYILRQGGSYVVPTDPLLYQHRHHQHIHHPRGLQPGLMGLQGLQGLQQPMVIPPHLDPYSSSTIEVHPECHLCRSSAPHPYLQHTLPHVDEFGQALPLWSRSTHGPSMYPRPGWDSFDYPHDYRPDYRADYRGRDTYRSEPYHSRRASSVPRIGYERVFPIDSDGEPDMEHGDTSGRGRQKIRQRSGSVSRGGTAVRSSSRGPARLDMEFDVNAMR